MITALAWFLIGFCSFLLVVIALAPVALRYGCGCGECCGSAICCDCLDCYPEDGDEA